MWNFDSGRVGLAAGVVRVLAGTGHGHGLAAGELDYLGLDNGWQWEGGSRPPSRCSGVSAGTGHCLLAAGRCIHLTWENESVVQQYARLSFGIAVDSKLPGGLTQSENREKTACSYIPTSYYCCTSYVATGQDNDKKKTISRLGKKKDKK